MKEFLEYYWSLVATHGNVVKPFQVKKEPSFNIYRSLTLTLEKDNTVSILIYLCFLEADLGLLPWEDNDLVDTHSDLEAKPHYEAPGELWVVTRNKNKKNPQYLSQLRWPEVGSWLVISHAADKKYVCVCVCVCVCVYIYIKLVYK